MDTAQVLAFSLVMLNTDAHNDAIRKDRKMTLQQYKNNLRGICKDGSSPDPTMLGAMYVGICRFPWQVEEREHVVKVREGWLHKVSSNTSGKVLPSHRRRTLTPALTPTLTLALTPTLTLALTPTLTLALTLTLPRCVRGGAACRAALARLPHQEGGPARALIRVRVRRSSPSPVIGVRLRRFSPEP